MHRPLLALLAAFAGSSAAIGQEAAASDAPDKTPSDFVRFVKQGDGGHLDTAITTYRKGDVELVLFGAVHIADEACYETLNDRFAACEVLLYELVGPEDYRPTREREDRGFNPIGMLQQGLKNSLELAFQLDAIDYSPANFVHADMTPKEFQESMQKRGESLLTIMLNMMLTSMQKQIEKAEAGEDEPSGESFDLVKAFRTGEGRHTLRMTFASQLEEIESMAAGGKEGSTLLEGRNEKCLSVLAREMAAGRKKIGIYYGAAHLPHMERRLVTDLGFRKVGHEWLVAWDCKRRPDVKYDRALVKQRQQCKAELAAIARAVWDHRSATPRTPQEVGELLRTGKLGDRVPAKDPWGRDYEVEARPNGRWQVRSVGQDGERGNADDLVAKEPRGG